ncbi:MAG: GNAT family N-acetyltransferase [Micrococcaceae bacterium]
MSLTPFTLAGDDFIEPASDGTDAGSKVKSSEAYRHLHRQVELGFYVDPGSEDLIDIWARQNREMGLEFRGVREAEPRPASLPTWNRPVATIGGLPSTLNVGAQVLPAWLITAVGVAPTHRRRGLLRQLMTEELTRAQELGYPLAALTVSEGGIYERFGFGVSTYQVSQSIDRRRGIQLRPEVLESLGTAAGRVYEVNPTELVDLADRLDDQSHRAVPGSIRRPRPVQENMLGAVNLWGGSAEAHRELKGYVYVTDDGPEALAVISHKGWENVEVSTGVIRDLQYSTRRGWAGLMDTVLNLDLVDELKYREAPGRALSTAMLDPRAVKTLSESDLVWTRLLDVVAALESRRYGQDGSLIIDVEDAMGLVDGLYRLDVSNGTPRAERVEAPLGADTASVTLDAAHLATALFRGAGALAAVGLVNGPAVEQFLRMVAVVQEPFCNFGF